MKALIALLLLGLVAAQAQSNAIDTIKQAKTDLFATIIDAAGLTDELSNSQARVTLLAPTDEAVKSFLKEMGLTADEALKNVRLARDLVAYHTVLGVTAGPKELFAKSNEVEVPTADDTSKLVFMKKGDEVLVKDMQGNVAKVSKASLGKGAATVHVVDKVLYSDSYFKDIASLIKTFPKIFSSVGAAAKKAGLADRLTKQFFSDTVFIPTNAAFEKAKVNVDATPKATLEQVLQYHVVPGARRIPAGFESGKKVPTLLKGQDVTVTYKDESQKFGLTERRAFVNDATVIKPNVIVSKGVAHVIDAVLTPKAAAAAAAAPAIAVATESAKKAGNRRLLQGNYRQQYASTVSLNTAEQAIWGAVNQADAAGAARATAVGVGSAKATGRDRFGAAASYARLLNTDN